MSGFIFQPSNYGTEVAEILKLDGNGERLMPLAMERCSSEAARERLRMVFKAILRSSPD